MDCSSEEGQCGDGDKSRWKISQHVGNYPLKKVQSQYNNALTALGALRVIVRRK